jgi:chromosome segregation ATPase
MERLETTIQTARNKANAIKREIQDRTEEMGLLDRDDKAGRMEARKEISELRKRLASADTETNNLKNQWYAFNAAKSEAEAAMRASGSNV